MSDRSYLRSLTVQLMLLALGLLVCVTLISLVALWPTGASKVDKRLLGVQKTEPARVVGLTRVECHGPSQPSCDTVTFRVSSGKDKGEQGSFQAGQATFGLPFSLGDRIRVYKLPIPTGTIVAGRDPAGNEFRTLGLGRVFGDFGSEFDVSELAVSAVADEYVGRGPSTMLSELLCSRTGVGTVEELLERISRADTRLRSPEVANMAPLVLQATEAGDLVARQILEEIGHSLGESAGYVASHLGMRDLDFQVVLAGNLFRTPNRYLLDQLELGVRRTAPMASLSILDAPPVVGAVLMALELASPSIVPGVAMALGQAASRRFRSGG